MKIDIKTKNLELTQALQNFTEKKFYTLTKFIQLLKKDEEKNTLAEALVELERETNHHRKGGVYIVKCRIQFPGRSLMAEVRSDDLLKAIVAAKDEMKMEIEKYKFKKTDVRRREQRKLKQEAAI
jgi:ribosomal subunit interface protein